MVTDRVENDVHYFDFVIPRGIPAPERNQATAQLYKTTGGVLNSEGRINFDIAQNFGNARVIQKDIIVQTGGAYHVDYGISAAATDNAVIMLTNNGAPIIYSSRAVTAAAPNVS